MASSWNWGPVPKTQAHKPYTLNPNPKPQGTPADPPKKSQKPLLSPGMHEVNKGNLDYFFTSKPVMWGVLIVQYGVSRVYYVGV